MNNTIPKEIIQNKYRDLRFQRLAVARELAKNNTHHRVGQCMHIMTGNFVEVNYSKDTGRAHYSGLVTCGSVWDCPVCSAKISMKREEELSQGIENWHKMGYKTIMITFTIRHNLGDSLEDLSEVLTDALRYVKSGAPYQRVKYRFGIQGTVTGTEVLYNLKNGWHYHKHMAVFLDKNFTDLELKDLEGWLFKRYLKYLNKHSFDALEGIGVLISDYSENGEELAEYMAKWGLEEEEVKPNWTLAKEITNNTKLSENGLNPFELLDRPELHYRYIEYSKTMFGKRRLSWSNGLRDVLGLEEELTDEEVMQEIEEIKENNEVYILISRQEWRFICENDLKVIVLERAERGRDYFKDWYCRFVRGYQ